MIRKLFKAIPKWLCSPSGIATLVLIGIDIGLYIWAKFLPEGDTKNIMSGSITEIIGIIITLNFVDILFKHHNDKKAKREEAKQILRTDKVISILIDKYTYYVHCMTHDYVERDKIPPVLQAEFSIIDMRFVHTPPDGHLNPFDYGLRHSVDLFLENELELRNLLVEVVENINYEYYPDFSDLLTDYIRLSYGFTLRDRILAYGESGMFDRPFAEEIKKVIEERGTDDLEHLKNGTHHTGDHLYPYLILYQFIIAQKAILVKYTDQINVVSAEMEAK